MTDTQLAVLSQQGDREAFTTLARRWDRRLFLFLNRLLGDEEEARDTCQETLLRAYLKIRTLRKPEHFKTWLHSIAVNLCRDRSRSTRSRTLREVAMEEAEAGEPATPAASPSRLAEQKDLAVIVTRMLARLSLEQRTAIMLREYEGFTSTEIADLTGVSATTVRSRIFYGLKALRRMLPEYGLVPGSFGESGDGR